MAISDLWRRKRQPDPEATHALAEARDALRQAKAQRPQVEHASSTLNRLGRENHFADSIATLVRSGR